jgi:hypothetical protein
MKYFIFLAILIGFNVSAANDKKPRAIEVQSKQLTLNKTQANKLDQVSQIDQPFIFSASAEIDSEGVLKQQCNKNHNHKQFDREDK